MKEASRNRQTLASHSTTPAPSTFATETVRSSVRAALLAEVDQPSVFTWPDVLAPDDFLSAVRRHRVAHVLADNAHALDLPEPVTSGLRAMRDAETMQSLVLARELARVSRVLDEADVRFLTFKGPALAVLSTGRVDSRGAGDLDIFVDPQQVGRAHEALVTAGWAADPRFPSPGSSWAWRHLVASYYEMPFTSAHSSVDLHWWLAPTRTALPDFATAWSRRASVPIADVDLPTLGLRDAFAHTCSHAAKDDWRWLRSLVDIHRLGRDPALWAGGRLGPVERMSLAATRDSVGLPDIVPPAIQLDLSQHARSTARAREQQDLPFDRLDPTRRPGQGVAHAVVRSVRGGRQPREVGRVAWRYLLPAGMTSDIHDRRGVSAAPKVLARRVSDFTAKTVRWTRRA